MLLLATAPLRAAGISNGGQKDTVRADPEEVRYHTGSSKPAV
jgi:hypothetical protein